MEDFFQCSLKLSLEEKLKFEQILVQKSIKFGTFGKNISFSWQIIESLKDLLEFFRKFA